MNKTELEAKLNDIQQRLVALGDLNVLVQKSTELPTLISQFQTTNTTAQGLIPKLTEQQKSIGELSEEAEGLKEELATKNTEVAELVEKATALQEKTENLKQETLAQLGLVANEKLSNSFDKVKNDLLTDKTHWFYWLGGAVVGLVLVTTGVAAWQVYDVGTLYHLSFLIKIALTAPIVYFIVFVNREYSRVRCLIEEYTFKAAIARSFEAYMEILQDAFAEQQATVYQKKLDFILQAVAGLYSSPMRNVKLNSVRQKEISPDIISQLKGHILPGSTDQ